MAGTEDLEQSLRAEVDSYLNGRLRGRQEEILRVQSQLNEALTRLAEQLSGDTNTDTSINVAIAEHLRGAVAAGTEQAGQTSSRAKATGDMALLKAAVDDLDTQRTQADILNVLVNRASAFAPRLAFFVIKNDRATGWRARGLEGSVGDNAVREISLPLAEQTLFGEVVRARMTRSGAPGANADDHELLEKLGGDVPSRIVAVPLLARERCVAVLYADSAQMEPESINLEALETLARVTGMAVELLATKRPAPATAQATTPTNTTVPTAAPTPPPVADTTASQPEEAPTIAGQPAAVELTKGDMREATGMTLNDDAATHEPSHHVESQSAPEADSASFATHTLEEMPAALPVAHDSALLSEATDNGSDGISGAGALSASNNVVAASSASPAGPLGTSRRYGMDTDLPVEVAEDERRFHNDARRFARLLVSEIKLYNEQKVEDGRERGDLYERLRDEIDRSRQMYDKRVQSAVAARYDYFHQEIVNTLAAGDPAKLGGDYPGATV